MWRFERSRKQHNASRVLSDPVQSRGKSSGRSSPHQKDCVDAMQTFIERVGKSEISAHHLNGRRQTSRVRVACHRTDLRSSSRQLRHNLAADVAGRSDDKDAIHAAQFYTTLITTFPRACPARRYLIASATSPNG